MPKSCSSPTRRSSLAGIGAVRMEVVKLRLRSRRHCTGGRDEIRVPEGKNRSPSMRDGPVGRAVSRRGAGRYHTMVGPHRSRRMPAKPKYQRILLKLSGEALMGAADYGIDPEVIGRIADEILEARAAGVQVGVVIGGGNIFRGAGLAEAGMDRVTGDHMGMLATVMNALAMQDALGRRRRAIRHLEKGRIVLFAGGTGNPFFTTDSAAALRAIEVGADLLLKATKVDGVYSADPKKKKDARRFEHVSYDDVIARNLKVMDTAAIALCRDHGLPLRIYDMTRPGNLMRILRGEAIGTLVDPG